MKAEIIQSLTNDFESYARQTEVDETTRQKESVPWGSYMRK